jgi:hypothetical protein
MSTLCRDEYTYGKDATLAGETLVRDVWRTFADANNMSKQLASEFGLFGDGDTESPVELGYNDDGSISFGREAWHHLMACTKWTFESKELASALDSDPDHLLRTLSFTGGSRSPSVNLSVNDDDDAAHSPGQTFRPSISISDSSPLMSPLANTEFSRFAMLLHANRFVSAHDASITVDPSTHEDEQNHVFGQWLSIEDMRMHWSWDVRKVTIC